MFESRVTANIVKLESGMYDDEIDIASFDQQKTQRDPATSRETRPNTAKIMRVPNHGMVFQLMSGDEVESMIIPIEGKGLWSTLYGFIALSGDTRTIQGITFYQHGETPGLGGEVDNPRWKALWPGRLAFDDNWKPVSEVLQGRAGSVEDDPHHVDGMAGAAPTATGGWNKRPVSVCDPRVGPPVVQCEGQRRAAVVAQVVRDAWTQHGL